MEENYTIRGSISHGILEKISFIILFAVSFLVPVFFVPISFISTQFGTSLLFAFGVILATLIYIISAFTAGSIDFPKSLKYLFVIFALVPMVYLLAGIGNGFSRMTFLGYTFDISTVGFMMLAFVYMFLISILFKNKERILNSYFAFLASSILFSVFILIRIIFGAEVLSFGIFTDLTGTMVGSWNNVGILFGVTTILSLLTFQMLNVSKLIKFLLLLALAFSLFILSLVNFSIIWIILAVCVLLYILYNLFGSQDPLFASFSLTEKILRTPLVPLLVLIVSGIFIIWGNSIGGYMANSFKITNIEVRPSLAVTLDIAKNTIKSQPLFGSGPNTFVTQWLTFKPDDITNTIFWNTDFTNGIGLIPTFSVTTGIFGILSWFVFFGFYLYFGVKSIFAKIEDSFLKYIVISSFFASLYLWIMAFVYTPSTVIFILSFFFTGLFFASLYIANIIPLTPYSFSYNPKMGFISSLTLVVIFVGVSALGFGLFKNSQSLWYFQKAFHSLNTVGNVTESAVYLNKAIKSSPFDIYYRALSEVELIKISAIISQDSKKVKIEDIQKQFSDTLSVAISAGISAKNADQTNYLNWIALGKVYESIVPFKIQGAYESAKFSYDEALRYNPKNPGILVLYARLAAANDDLKAARNYALQAISVKQNYLDAYFLLSQIEVADKNLKGAIDSVTAASIIDPTNSAVFFQLGLLKYNLKDFDGAIVAFEKSISLVPDYANAKYFLGLSYESIAQHDKAIAQFRDLRKTNPESKEVEAILTNLEAGKPIFVDNAKAANPEKATKLPVKEQQ